MPQSLLIQRFLLEPQQRRIDRALVERERALRDLLDAPGDAVAVQRAKPASVFSTIRSSVPYGISALAGSC